MVRKHSPGRSPQSCPSGDFSSFSAEMVQNDFLSICTVKNCVFRENEKHALDHFSDLLESALHLEISSIHKVFRAHCLGRENVQKIYVLRERHEIKFDIVDQNFEMN